MKEITTNRSYRAFSDGSKTRRFYVDTNNRDVRAWDSMAGHYTVANSLTQRQKAMILTEAR